MAEKAVEESSKTYVRQNTDDYDELPLKIAVSLARELGVGVIIDLKC